MRMVTLDPSSKGIAFAVWNDNKLETYGMIYPNGSGDSGIGSFTHQILGTFDKVDVLVYEAAYMGNNVNVLKVLSKIDGAIIAGFYLLGTKHFKSVPPITWQTGIGVPKTSKTDLQKLADQNRTRSASWVKSHDRINRKLKVIDLVNKRFGLKLTIDENDIADAIGIGCYMIDNTEVLNEVQA